MKNNEVIAEIYEFLKNNENGLYEKNEEIRAYVLVSFHDLKEFSEIVGATTFDDGGLEVRMFDTYIAIDLNEIFEGYGHGISNYKNCFNKHDYQIHEDLITKNELD